MDLRTLPFLIEGLDALLYGLGLDPATVGSCLSHQSLHHLALRCSLFFPLLLTFLTVQ